MNATEVADVVGLVWSTILELDISPTSPNDRTAWTGAVIQAQVHIAGTWQGAIVLQASPALVSRIARLMFDLGDAEPGAEEIQDAFGEVANITGGNLKGLLSEADAHLSLPAVVHGTDYTVRVPGSREVGRFGFSCDGEPLVVTVLQAEPDAGVTSTGRAARRERSTCRPA